MRKAHIGRKAWLLGLGAVVIVILVLASWPAVQLTFGIIFSERVPTLLSDAGWGKPSSAQKFQRKFHQGVPEGELLAWLESNRFDIDQSAGHAVRLVRGLPCNENIEVTWAVDGAHRIKQVSAEVSEAGCL